MRLREDQGILLGVGAGLALLVMLVLQATSSSGIFGTTTETVTATSTEITTLGAEGAVSQSFAQHMGLLLSGNASALAGQYEPNATITWVGDANGLQGKYIGTTNIKILFGSFLDKVEGYGISNETQAIGPTENGEVTVNSHFAYLGQSLIVGNMSATIAAQDVYAYSPTNGSWLIAQETWNFTSFYVEYPVST